MLLGGDDDLFAHTAKKLRVEFDDVITAQQCGSYKPSLNNFRIAAKRVGVPKSKWLHVAQSLFHDHEPARRAGLATVWIDRRAGRAGFGATPPPEDAAVRPDWTFASLAELADAVSR